MLGANVVVVKPLRFFLGKRQDFARALGESIKAATVLHNAYFPLLMLAGSRGTGRQQEERRLAYSEGTVCEEADATSGCSSSCVSSDGSGDAGDACSGATAENSSTG